MRILIATWAAIALAPVLAQDAASSPVLSTQAARSDVRLPARRRTVLRVTAKVEVPAESDAAHLDLWIAAPKLDDNQSLIDVKTDEVKVGTLTRRVEPVNQNAFLHLDVDAPRGTIECGIAWTLERHEILASRFRQTAPRALNDQELASLAAELGPNERVPVTGRLKVRADGLARGEQNPINVARAVYDDVLRTMEFRTIGAGWGLGDSLWAADAGFGDAMDFHSLFTSLTRARGIPTRFTCGLLLPSGPTSEDQEITGNHSWAEFYVADLGWIPVDVAQARKNPDSRQYYFGNVSEDRVAFTTGRDIPLTPPSKSERHNFFLNPYGELDGKPIAVTHRFTFRDA